MLRTISNKSMLLKKKKKKEIIRTVKLRKLVVSVALCMHQGTKPCQYCTGRTTSLKQETAGKSQYNTDPRWLRIQGI